VWGRKKRSSASYAQADDREMFRYIMCSRPLHVWLGVGISEIEPHWLVEAAKPMCTLSAPLEEPPPQYMVKHDAVMAWQDVSFGMHDWHLPRSRVVHPDPAIRARAFAAALLDGSVLPSMAGNISFTNLHASCPRGFVFVAGVPQLLTPGQKAGSIGGRGESGKSKCYNGQFPECLSADCRSEIQAGGPCRYCIEARSTGFASSRSPGFESAKRLPGQQGEAAGRLEKEPQPAEEGTGGLDEEGGDGQLASPVACAGGGMSAESRKALQVK
jgi:hypothetical protein